MQMRASPHAGLLVLVVVNVEIPGPAGQDSPVERDAQLWSSTHRDVEVGHELRNLPLAHCLPSHRD